VKAEDLYALPLSEFTQARNALAKESGDKSIAKLRKPSAAAWALNQAARSHKGDVGRFLHAAAGVRDAADREALAELRGTEADVRRAALHALGDSAGAQLAAINMLLSAAASDEEVGEVLRAGRLTGDEEADASGFIGMVSPREAAQPRQTDEVRQARERKEQREREAARKKLEEARRRAHEAEDEAKRLEREAAEAEEAAARLRARADTARAKADRLAQAAAAAEAEGP
jgi:hypothetical protein